MTRGREWSKRLVVARGLARREFRNCSEDSGRPASRDRYGLVVNDREVRAGQASTPGYRYAELVGAQLFVAGQVPLDADGTLVGAADPSAQATRCLDNLRLVLGVHDFDVADIRHLVIYVVGEHRNLLDAWSAVSAWFDNDVPPATLLGVNLLGYGDQLVEIDATVVKQPGRMRARRSSRKPAS